MPSQESLGGRGEGENSCLLCIRELGTSTSRQRQTSGEKPAESNQQRQTSGDKPVETNQRRQISGDKPAERNKWRQTSGEKPAERNQRRQTSGDKPADKKQKNRLLFLLYWISQTSWYTSKDSHPQSLIHLWRLPKLMSSNDKSPLHSFSGPPISLDLLFP